MEAAAAPLAVVKVSSAVAITAEAFKTARVVMEVEISVVEAPVVVTEAANTMEAVTLVDDVVVVSAAATLVVDAEGSRAAAEEADTMEVEEVVVVDGEAAGRMVATFSLLMVSIY